MQPRISKRGMDDVVRFGPRQRIEHGAAMCLVLVLGVTGLAQAPGSHWGRVILDAFGGLGPLRAMHRVAGWLLAALVAAHLAVSIWLLAARGRTSMLVAPRDFRDAVDFLRWCLGLRTAAPRMDRFHYRQKFEYWALLLATVTMIASGVVLVYPMQVTAWLPGVVVAAARLAHGSEALLVLGTALAWHVYSTVLHPEVFPLDRSIFTGRISRERLRREHALEYERLEP